MSFWAKTKEFFNAQFPPRELPEPVVRPTMSYEIDPTLKKKLEKNKTALDAYKAGYRDGYAVSYYLYLKLKDMSLSELKELNQRLKK